MNTEFDMEAKTNKKPFVLLGVGLLLIVVGILVSTGAKKDKYYQVSFDTSGGGYRESVNIKKGQKLGTIVKPTREGYLFSYWTINGQAVTDDYEIQSDVKLVAVWEAKTSDEKDETVKEYIVKFDSDGGGLVSSQAVKENEKAVKPTNPTKEGYTFKEWTLDGKKYDFSEKVEKDITLKATWEKKKDTDNSTNPSTNGSSTEKKYTVTFNSNGGSAVKSQTVVDGKKATKPANPTKNGYNFAGWFLNGKAYNFSSVVTKNITLLAKWTKANTYTVTFDSSGGSAISSQTVLEGGKATKPTDPTRNGYRFDGWLLNGSVYSFNSVVTKNITLTAKWVQLNSYTVTFNSNGGSTVASQTVLEGGKATKPTDPTKSGYNFTGWFLNNNVYNFSSVVTGNIELVAQWAQKSYTISVTKVDIGSTDVRLIVFEDNVQISVQNILYSDGGSMYGIPNQGGIVVSSDDISGVTSFIVVLNSGAQVRATLR